MRLCCGGAEGGRGGGAFERAVVVRSVERGERSGNDESDGGGKRQLGKGLVGSSTKSFGKSFSTVNYLVSMISTLRSTVIKLTIHFQFTGSLSCQRTFIGFAIVRERGLLHPCAL